MLYHLYPHVTSTLGYLNLIQDFSPFGISNTCVDKDNVISIVSKGQVCTFVRSRRIFCFWQRFVKGKAQTIFGALLKVYTTYYSEGLGGVFIHKYSLVTTQAFAGNSRPDFLLDIDCLTIRDISIFEVEEFCNTVVLQ